MGRQFLGFVAAAAAAAGILFGGHGAAADPIEIKITRNLGISGALNGTQTLTIPAFIGPGVLTSVHVLFTLDDFGQDIFVNGQPSGEVQFSASATFSLSAPGLFALVVPPVENDIPDTTLPVFGGNYLLAGSDIGAPMLFTATVTTGLDAFANGPFDFVATIVGTLDAQTPDGVTLVSTVSANGSLVVTYISEFDGDGVPIPEPAGLALLALGLGAITFVRRRRERRVTVREGGG